MDVSSVDVRGVVVIGKKPRKRRTHPLLKTWRSDAQIPQCVTAISISSSSHFLGVNDVCLSGDVASVAIQPWKTASSSFFGPASAVFVGMVERMSSRLPMMPLISLSIGGQ